MTQPPSKDPATWLLSLFAAKAAAQGGVIHRSVGDVERIAGREAFVTEVRRRGFTLVENADQFVVFCNRDPVRLIVDRDKSRLSDRAFPVFRRSSVANDNSSRQA